MLVYVHVLHIESKKLLKKGNLSCWLIVLIESEQLSLLASGIKLKAARQMILFKFRYAEFDKSVGQNSNNFRYGGTSN